MLLRVKNHYQYYKFAVQVEIRRSARSGLYLALTIQTALLNTRTRSAGCADCLVEFVDQRIKAVDTVHTENVNVYC